MDSGVSWLSSSWMNAPSSCVTMSRYTRAHKASARHGSTWLRYHQRAEVSSHSKWLPVADSPPQPGLISGILPTAFVIEWMLLAALHLMALVSSVQSERTMTVSHWASLDLLVANPFVASCSLDHSLFIVHLSNSASYVRTILTDCSLSNRPFIVSASLRNLSRGLCQPHGWRPVLMVIWLGV